MATTYYVNATDGDDGNTGTGPGPGAAFLTLEFALSVAVSGDTVLMLNGDHGVSVAIVPAGVTLQGMGPDKTSITCNATLTSLGCIVTAGSNAVLRGFSIIGSGSAGDSQAGIGFNVNASLSQPASDNVLVENVRVTCDSDGTYFRDNNGSTAAHWTFKYCQFNTKYDAHTILGRNDNIIVDFYYCDFNVQGPTAVGGPSNTNPVRVVTGAVSLTRCYYCSLDGAGGNGGSYAAYANQANVSGTINSATIELHDCSLNGTTKDVYANLGTVTLYDCTYDTSKEQTINDGTITASWTGGGTIVKRDAFIIRRRPF